MSRTVLHMNGVGYAENAILPYLSNFGVFCIETELNAGKDKE